MKLYFGLFFAFLVSVVAGTLSHEAAHYVAAKALGYEPKLHFAYCDFHRDPAAEAYIAWRRQNKTADRLDMQHHVQAYDVKSKNDYFLITLCGPLQSTLFGTIGLVLLWIKKRKWPAAYNTTTDWLLIFLSLFWLRAMVNFLAWLLHVPLAQAIPGQPAGDELKLAAWFSLPSQSITITTAVLSAIVGGVVFFRFIPAVNRRIFLLAGLSGGALGCWLWFFKLGPLVLP